MRPIPRGDGALQLLLTYLSALREDLALAPPELSHLVASHIHGLVAAAIGANRDGAARAAKEGVRAARLAAIKADVVAHLDGCDLSLAAVAARQHITPRHIQRLFEGEDVTFSEFVLGQRLARVRRMLVDRRYAGLTVSAIAFAAGFGDLSYFYRVFRRRFGATPSDIRADARPHQPE